MTRRIELTRQAVRKEGRKAHWTLVSHVRLDNFGTDDGRRVYVVWNDDGTLRFAKHDGERVGPDTAATVLPKWFASKRTTTTNKEN